MNETDIFFGADYYPEHWPQQRWEIDAQLMKAAGINAVRMAEFAWAKMESSINQFTFNWLDDAIALFAKYDIAVILGTPTAAPPAWIIESNPEILPVNKMGVRMGFGGRHHVCHSNSVYREHCIRIVKAIADHYKNNTVVIGWQIDNELGNSHEQLCFCENCRSNFQKWLEKKYSTINKLNESWGTVFWSQSYNNFSQIPAPKNTPNSHNPSLLLDWKRFCSDLIIDFQQLQIDIIRSACPDTVITGNFMGFFEKVDYFKLAHNLDFASHDQYPGGFWLKDIPENSASSLAASLDFMRGIKDMPFWIMEQQAGPCGWETMGQTPRPGQLALWTAQSIAHGADAVFFFRWRSCAFGTEQFWHGILPHSGVPGRRYEEISNAITQLHPVMEDIKGLKNHADAAILFSYDQFWALGIQPQHPDLNYVQHLLGYYQYFFNTNIPVDFISEETDFSDYKLLIAPLQFVTKPLLLDKMCTYVSNGGNLVLSMRTGVKDENNVCYQDFSLPCNFSGLTGIKINDYDCLCNIPVPVEFEEEIAGMAHKWCDIIDVQTAKTMACYASEYYKDAAALTVNSFGKGLVYYIGFEPDISLMNSILDHITVKHRIVAVIESPENVEVIMRPAINCNYYFVLNHNGKAISFIPKPEWKAVIGTDKIEPYGFTVYSEGNTYF